MGGLSTALALRLAGCDVQVYERAAAVIPTTGAVSPAFVVQSHMPHATDSLSAAGLGL